jgi:hypothetical protein
MHYASVERRAMSSSSVCILQAQSDTLQLLLFLLYHYFRVNTDHRSTDAHSTDECS